MKRLVKVKGKREESMIGTETIVKGSGPVGDKVM